MVQYENIFSRLSVAYTVCYRHIIKAEGELKEKKKNKPWSECMQYALIQIKLSKKDR